MDLNTIKLATKTGVSWCVGTTVIMLIKQNTYPDSKSKKVQTSVGGVALALMIQEHVGEYTDRWIDSVAQAFEKPEDENTLNH
jgi:hypothetical protein